MAASQEQKVDFLLKKIGYVASKTGIAEDSSLSGTKKAPFGESIPSPLVTPASSVWAEAAQIPETPPGSDTSFVRVYLSGSSGHRMTVDSTVSGNRTFIAHSTYNDNTTAILGDWIDPLLVLIILLRYSEEIQTLVAFSYLLLVLDLMILGSLIIPLVF